MNISTGKRILPFLLILFLIPTSSWGSCFNPSITRLTETKQELKAKVLAKRRLDPRHCQLTLSVAGLRISGEASRPLCDANIGETVSVRIRAACCDTQPCPTGQKNRLLFSIWNPPETRARSEPAETLRRARRLPAARAPEPVLASPRTEPMMAAPEPMMAAPELAMAAPEADETMSTRSLPLTAADNGGGADVMANGGSGDENGISERRVLALESASPPPASDPLDKYKVELGVDGEIFRPGPPAQLKVWIGAPTESAGFTEDMATAETIIAAVAPYGLVKPNAPDFEVEPKESICIAIDPTGSEVTFAITPKHTGTLTVGATVRLYRNETCTGAPVPKSSADLEVEVKVNPQGWFKYYALQLWDVLWERLLDFWTWLVITMFGLAAFLIKRKLKKRFDYDAPDANPPGGQG